MRAWHNSRYFRTDVVVFVVLALVIAVLGLTASRSRAPAPRRMVATVLSGPRGSVRRVPAGFLGLSLEYPALEAYAGSDPAAINPLFRQLVRNVSPGQAPVLRIGGDSADWTWWPISGLTAPPGVRYALSQGWLRVTHALVHALGARVILGVNFEANSTELASTEAAALIDGIGRGAVQALELGNEPELYAVFPWYRAADGRRITGRASNFDFAAFTRNYTAFAAALPSVPLAGPAVSGPGWMRRLDGFLVAEPRVGLVTLHRYPLQLCFVSRRSPRYPTVEHLLQARASSGLADTFKPYVAIAHAHGLALRIDELNTVSCGADNAVSKTFASALWVLDTLFEMVSAGVDGVNVHTFPGAGYELFQFSHKNGRWRAVVAPEYYGLLTFAHAAPAGAELLPVAGTRPGPVTIWATRGPDRRIRVVVINEDLARPLEAALAVPATGTATLQRLLAPSISATGHVTLGGQGFGSASDTATLRGNPQAEPLPVSNGRYMVKLPPASAALLTVATAVR